MEQEPNDPIVAKITNFDEFLVVLRKYNSVCAESSPSLGVIDIEVQKLKAYLERELQALASQIQTKPSAVSKATAILCALDGQLQSPKHLLIAAGDDLFQYLFNLTLYSAPRYAVEELNARDLQAFYQEESVPEADKLNRAVNSLCF